MSFYFKVVHTTLMFRIKDSLPLSFSLFQSLSISISLSLFLSLSVSLSLPFRPFYFYLSLSTGIPIIEKADLKMCFSLVAPDLLSSHTLYCLTKNCIKRQGPQRFLFNIACLSLIFNFLSFSEKCHLQNTSSFLNEL